MNNENRLHCIEIAKTLEQIVDGRMYICPECGEFIWERRFDNEDAGYTCTCCKSEGISLDDCEQASLFDYFTDSVLDVEYRINARHEFKNVRLMVACGGPNIFIDTGACEVQLHWWTEYASCPIDMETCEAINECYEDLFNC